MRRVTYHRRSLSYHWRTNLAVAIGAAAGTAALTGALIVGDSMRASLRELAIGRLGRVDHALIVPRFFQVSLGSRIAALPTFAENFEAAYPAILLRGGLTHADLRTRVDDVNVIGVNEDFWRFHGLDPPPLDGGFSGRFVLLNETLARDLQANAGDDVLLRMGKHSPISTETLLGRRDETVAMLRLPVRGIVPDGGHGESRASARADAGNASTPGASGASIGPFSLNLRQGIPRNVFVPMAVLQRALDQSDRANAILVSTRDTYQPRTAGLSLRDQSDRLNDRLMSMLQSAWTIEDIGLRLRIDNERGYVAIESESILIDPAIERGIDRVMVKRGYDDSKILAHLANRIATDDNQTGIPYSTIVALKLPSDLDIRRATPGRPRTQVDSPRHVLPGRMSLVGFQDVPQPRPDERRLAGDVRVLLNQWAANDLGATVGQRIFVTYYIMDLQGRIEERTAIYQLAGIIPMDHRLADAGLVPTYPGITDVDRLSDWNAPFPIDFTRIRDKDETYWDEYRTLPKAYIDLRMGQKLWAPHGDRHGRITAVLVRTQSTIENRESTIQPGAPDTSRERNASGQGNIETSKRQNVETNQNRDRNRAVTVRERETSKPLNEVAEDIAETFTSEVDPATLGLKFEPIRAQALAASEGTTDFGLLFIGFSFFLIASAAMLVALLFRLGIERRASEVGLLLANGFTPAAVGRMLLGQGTIIAVIGGLVGLIGAGGYAWLMLAGLRTWWSAAVNTPVLRLEATPASLAIGWGASVLIALLSMAWAVRGLTRLSPRALLAGAVQPNTGHGKPHRAHERAAGSSVAPDSSRWDITPRDTSAPRAAGLSLRGSARAEARGSPARLRFATVTTIAALLIAIALIVFTVRADAQTQAVAFFGAGAAVIVALLAFLRLLLHGRPAGLSLRGSARAKARGSLSDDYPMTPGIASGITTLGIRNASRHVGRSMLTAGLIASATFVIASIQAFRLEADAHWLQDKHSGSGGFALYAESAVPLPYDLSTPDGRDALALDREADTLLDNATVIPFRLRPGDESSCLNLYRPTDPRILGAPDAMIDRGGFAFAASLAETDTERQNPWLLLHKPLTDGTIPAIADEAVVRWQFHLGLGQDLIVRDDRGQEQRLRFVALLKQSLLQDEVIVAETHFTHLFPSISGHGFFLIDPPSDRPEPESVFEKPVGDSGFRQGMVREGVHTGKKPLSHGRGSVRTAPLQTHSATPGDTEPFEALQQSLERGLERFSFDVRRSADRINEYLAVQNTYLSTFRNLGGLGLLLGTTGLAAVLLRNVWERRRELALLRALGFSHAAIGWMVLAENAALLLYGLAAGFLSALVAIAPTIASDPTAVPWLSVLGTLMGVLIVGLGVSVAAMIPTLRTPLLPALRSE